MSSLYLHIPFCSRKCPYCDFFSQVGTAQQIDDYVALLLLQLRLLASSSAADLPALKTIFFGGGTPSLLSSEQLEAILEQIDQIFSLEGEIEINLEANPGTVDRQQLERYRRAGVNRLSFGVQSLDPARLKMLGRIHSVEQVSAGIEAARDAGFDNLSLDLMFALPGQSLADLENEVSRLLEFSPEHVSLYGLTYEAGTPFYRQLQSGTLSPCDDDLYAEQYRLLDQRLVSAGFDHYEISNFARPGRQCRHNLNYWQRKSCLAVGAGSHSFMETQWGERWHVPADLKVYAECLRQGRDPARLLENYNRDTAMREYVYLALRTRSGVSEQHFCETFDCSFAQTFAPELRQVEHHLQLGPDGDSSSFDLSGWLIYDHLISHFLV